MSDAAVFAITLEADLHEDFVAAAEATHRTADDIMREMMVDFVEDQRRDPGYSDFVRRKVEAARASLRAGQGRPNDEIEAEYAARRRAVGGE